ncbi:site-specific DNA-methyltransferase [Candidatus Heimdallarchaeota archaeon]|nr:MAG: site-specific DNA-methyltransferase [Candidatus Heimdallarchaeota archaeon]
MGKGSIDIIHGNNFDILKSLESGRFRLIYMDPPFNTGKVQSKLYMKNKPSEEGDRRGFKGKKYKTEVISNIGYEDTFENLSDFLYPRLEECKRLLTDDGSVFVHLDYREVHDVKVHVMDKVFGRENFKNEIIWAYDYGAKPKNRWPAKHDTILWYVKDNDNYVFNYDRVDRVPYMAPNLVSKEKAEEGKMLTDVWWNTIVCGKEKTGYPTQKPIAITDRIVKVHSKRGDWLLDPFAGSGTFGQSAMNFNRNCVLVDQSEESIKVMKERFSNAMFFYNISISEF